MHSEDVVHPVDAETSTSEGEIRLWVLTKVNTVVHGQNDVRL